ncbi:glycosyltransferase family 22 protein [Rhodotorula graminis WP1]|uniref:Mannosyltransferase n=1 Tax=Rhodotorula graminis (strain WP1) TaxID=578459 RepID=A0A0P9FBY6_RHOGW|nr:glycosyltransferase family 22 protein [Rhodotorula graminis WP1]KPV73163.1 glycosyltransferase family 22 protein [Rhodotorula graminis WP1]
MARALLLRWAEACVVLSLVAHVVVVPGVKVEESFSLTAVRDVVVHGLDQPQRFDHVEFEGAVPRSFIAPIALAAVALLPFKALSALELVRTGLEAQLIVRLTLALASALSVVFLSRSVRAAYGAKVAKYFLVLAATQFHVPYWAGRTLPNVLAFPLVQIALALFVCSPSLSSISNPRRSTRLHLLSAFSLLTFTAVVIRLELAALVAPFALEHLARGLVGVRELVVTGVVSAAASLALSVVVDSYFWQSPTWLWPEGQAFLFNVVEGKSADWGVSPASYYFLSALPKLLHLSLLPAALSIFSDRRTRRLVIPCLAFVAVLSGLEHKEWRFVVYVVPALTVAAAAGVVAVGALTASPLVRRLVLLSLLSLNALQTLLGLAASAPNYPGADALAFLEAHALLPATTPRAPQHDPWRVHVGTAAKMTGASNFVVLDSARARRAGDGGGDGDGPSSGAWYLAPLVPAERHAAVVVYDRAEPRAPWASYDFALVAADEALPPDAEVLYTASEFGGWDGGALLRGEWGKVSRRRDAVRVVRLPRGE